MTTTDQTVKSIATGRALDHVRLTPTQRLLLAAAAARDGGALLPPPPGLKLGGSALQKVLASLLRHGLVAEAAAGPEDCEWRRQEAGPPLTLRISPAGLTAAGTVSEQVASEQQHGRTLAVGGQAEGGTGTKASKAAQRLNGTGPAETAAEATVLKARRGGGSPHDGAADPPRRTKAGIVVELLSRGEGAAIAEMAAATGWQPHSVRGFLSGALKKRRGFRIEAEKDDAGVRRYRIVAS